MRLDSIWRCSGPEADGGLIMSISNSCVSVAEQHGRNPSFPFGVWITKVPV
jgi:hypothetical protein